jgi:hypothetical protein
MASHVIRDADDLDQKIAKKRQPKKEKKEEQKVACECAHTGRVGEGATRRGEVHLKHVDEIESHDVKDLHRPVVRHAGKV